jgi:hypothetical protein
MCVLETAHIYDEKSDSVTVSRSGDDECAAEEFVEVPTPSMTSNEQAEWMSTDSDGEPAVPNPEKSLSFPIRNRRSPQPGTPAVGRETTSYADEITYPSEVDVTIEDIRWPFRHRYGKKGATPNSVTLRLPTKTPSVDVPKILDEQYPGKIGQESSLNTY